MPITQSATNDLRFSATRVSSVAFPALMAMAFGLFIVGVVGFSHIDILHNATHDVRHANGFPCH